MEGDIILKKFNQEDIQFKVNLINDSNINEYLHFDLPLTVHKTKEWYKMASKKNNRADYTIFLEEKNKLKPIGILGILDIDERNRKGEYYITLVNDKYRPKGSAYRAGLKLLDIAFNKMNLNKICFYTEVNNVKARKLAEHLGFILEGTLRDDLIYNNRKIDRVLYSILKEEFISE